MKEARDFVLRWKRVKDEVYIKNFTEVLLYKVKFV